jgi:MFS family permease
MTAAGSPASELADPPRRRSLLDRVAPAELGRDFRWLWASSTLTNLGDGLLLSAGPLLVTTITREPAAVAAAVLLQQLPWVLFGIPAGAFVDRHDRRRMVAFVNALRSVVLGLLALTVASGTVSLPLIYVAAFLLGTAETFADTASSALTPSVVPTAGLGLANARFSASATLTNMIIGPSVGALLFGIAMAVPLTVNALLALGGAVLITRITARPAPSADVERHLGREIVDGMRWLWRHAAVRALFLTILSFNVTFGAGHAIYVLLAKDRLGLGDVGFGLLISAGAVGGIIGALSYGWLARRFALASMMRVGLMVETTSHLILAITTSPLVAAASVLALELQAVVWGTTSTTIRQRAVPSPFLGRVTSIYRLGMIGGLAAGAALGGVIAQTFGVTGPFWFGFIGNVVLLVLIWRTLGDIAHAPTADGTE